MKTAEHVRAGCFALPRRAVRAPSSLVHTKLQRQLLLGVAGDAGHHHGPGLRPPRIKHAWRPGGRCAGGQCLNSLAWTFLPAAVSDMHSHPGCLFAGVYFADAASYSDSKDSSEGAHECAACSVECVATSPGATNCAGHLLLLVVCIPPLSINSCN